MHCKKILITSSVLLSLVLNLTLCKRPNNTDFNQVHIGNLQDINFYLLEVLFNTYTNASMPIDNHTVYAGKSFSDTIRLKQIAGDGILILRFSDDACNICINFALSMVKKVFPDYQQNERIVFLVSQVPERLKDSYYGKPVYSFTEEELNLPFEKYHIPYFMVLDQSMECKLFFIPEMSHPMLTEFYLSTVKNRYFPD